MKSSLSFITQLLIDHGAEVNAVDKYKLTALHHAAIRGNLNAVKRLLDTTGIDREVRYFLFQSFSMTYISNDLYFINVQQFCYNSTKQDYFHFSSPVTSLPIFYLLRFT